MRSILLLVCCLLLLSEVACRHTSDSSGSVSPTDILEEDVYQEEEWADSVMRGMTLEEKVGQLFMPAVYSRIEEEDIQMLRFYADSCHTGGILLLKGDAESAVCVAGILTELSDINPWIAIDAEWGLGMRISNAPVYPRNGRMDRNAGRQVLFDYGEEMARECRLLGINMVMGPVADVASERSFIGSRSFGEDPQYVADMVTAYASGLESGGVVSVAKHFPGHGRGVADSHREVPVISISRDSLEFTDLYPFRRYADAGLSGIMAGHIAVTALDSTGTPATVSRRILTDFLRNDIKFSGLIITDALNMRGADGYKGADAIAAGADIVVAPASTLSEIRETIRRVRDGELAGKVIDNRCRRILIQKYRHRVEGPYQRKIIRRYGDKLRKALYYNSDSLTQQLSPLPQ